MSPINTEFAPAGIALRSVEGTGNGTTTRSANVVKPSPTCEAETHFKWEQAAGPAPRALATIQLIVLALFFLAGLIAMVNAFSELSHLLQSDSVGYVAERAINGSR
jgi:hypothetical protein